MKNHKFTIATFIILLANLTFSQESNIKGKIIDYESNKAIPAVMIYDSENTENGTVSDGYGDFKIKLQGSTGELHLIYLSFYTIKFLNMPIRNNKDIDFGEIRLVSNHQMDNMTIGGPPLETTKEQKEEDKRLRQNVIKNYTIKIQGIKLMPYFEENFLVFDFNKIENK